MNVPSQDMFGFPKPAVKSGSLHVQPWFITSGNRGTTEFLENGKDLILFCSGRLKKMFRIPVLMIFFVLISYFSFLEKVKTVLVPLTQARQNYNLSYGYKMKKNIKKKRNNKIMNTLHIITFIFSY